jgi:hypothetical protein
MNDISASDLRVNVRGRAYFEHRLAYFWMTGAWPKCQIDHCDGNGANNAWRNLRACTQSQNQQNNAMRIDNTSGVIGVTWNKRRMKWQMQMQATKGHRVTGYYDTVNEASAAYLAAKMRFHTFNPIPRSETTL